MIQEHNRVTTKQIFSKGKNVPNLVSSKSHDNVFFSLVENKLEEKFSLQIAILVYFMWKVAICWKNWEKVLLLENH